MCFWCRYICKTPITEDAMYPYYNNTPMLYLSSNKIEGTLVNPPLSSYSGFKLPAGTGRPTAPAISFSFFSLKHTPTTSLYMGSSSINTFSLYSQIHHSPTYQRHRLHNTTLKPPLSLHHPKFLPAIPLQTTPKPSHFFKIFPQPHVPHIPTSNLPNTITCSLSPQKKFSNIFSKKVVVLLVGSVLFMGCLRTRPFIALPAQASSVSENTEERRDTQNGKCEDEEMYVRLLEKNPRDVEALKVVLYGKMRKGKTEEAVEYVERLIDIEPEEVEWRLLQALCYETMGQLSKAKRFFKEILEERPLNPRALHVCS